MEATIEEHDRIELNAKEWERMQDLLENPPEPNEKMKALLARGKQLTKKVDNLALQHFSVSQIT